MTEVTRINTHLARNLTVKEYEYGDEVFLTVADTNMSTEISTALTKEESATLGKALLGLDATVITNLPEAVDDGAGYVTSGYVGRQLKSDPEHVENVAKNLLAIAQFIRAQNAADKAVEAEAAEKLVQLTKVRDTLADLFRPTGGKYSECTIVTRNAIDYIIEQGTNPEPAKNPWL